MYRGGSWGYDASDFRASCRYGREPGCRGVNLGFRLLRSVS